MPTEVAVVAVVPRPASGGASPPRDRSNDSILAKFVVCIVEMPCVIIGITLAISAVIAGFTLYQVTAVYGIDRWFAESDQGSEDSSHITSLSFDAIAYAFDQSWPDDPAANSCFRRLAERADERPKRPTPPTSGLQQFFGPLAERMEHAFASEGVSAQFGLAEQMKTLPRDLRTEPLPRAPVDWTRETGIIWEDQLLTSNKRRRLDDGFDCDEGSEGELEVGNVTVYDYSNCDVHAARKPKNPLTREGATGPGCNALCDPEEEPDCEATLMNSKDFYVMVLESVSGDNAYYGQQDEAYNPYGDGPGDSFSVANIKEAKRLQDVILRSDKYYSDFCLIKANPTSDPPNQGQCDGISSVMNFFHPRAKLTGQAMFDEMQRVFPEGMTAEQMFADISLASQTEFGCHMQYFFFELYEGGAGSAKWIEILSVILLTLTASPTTSVPLAHLGGGDSTVGTAVCTGPKAGTVVGLTCEVPNEMFVLKQTLLPMLIATVEQTDEDSNLGGFSAVFEIAVCGSLVGPAKTEDECTIEIGCQWKPAQGGCVRDTALTSDSEKFADVMCLGDGSGPTQSADWNTERAQLLAKFHAEDHLKPFLDYYFDRGFGPSNPTTKFSRAFIRFGGPIPGYRNIDDGLEPETGVNTQEQAFVDWFMNDQNNPSGLSVRDEFADKSTASEADGRTGGQVEVTYLLSALIFDEIIALIVGDMLLAVISFAVVGFYMWFQTGSLWIAMFGMLEISMSLPIALWVYTYVFGIEYFDTMCALALYIVMAIGADDVFIWFDAYKQSAHETPEISSSLETRFIWAWHKAASAMLVTSLTTCVAFFATATSPLPSIQSFGYYTAVVIFLDYIYVITWLPAATVLYSRWFENTGFCRCQCCVSIPACMPANDDQNNKKAEFPCCLTGGDNPSAIACGALTALPPAVIFSGYFFYLGGLGAMYAKAYGIAVVLFLVMSVGITVRVFKTIVGGKESRAVVEFFEGAFSNFITAERARKGLLIGFICAAVPFFVAAFYLTPTTKAEQILPDDHPLQKIITIMNTEFPVSGRDEKVREQLVFGLDGDEPFDRKGAHPLWDYMRNKQAEADANVDQPEANYVPLDWTDPRTQQFLAETCVALDASDFVVADIDPECEVEPCEQFKTSCIVADLGVWLSTNCTEMTPNTGCKSAFDPVPENHPGFPGSYMSYYGASCASAGCFLSAETSPIFASDPPKANRALWDFYHLLFKDTFPKAVGFKLDEPAECVSQIDIRTNEAVAYCAPNPDKGVQYIAFEYSVDLKSKAYYPEADFRNIYEQIEAFATDNVNAAKGVPVRAAHRTTVGKWKFMHTQHIYVKYALWGIACAIALAFCVLCVATNNIIVATLAVGTICAVCCCVLGAMVFAGWELGNMESICLTILAGFCVDYIVHLAHSYMESPDRSDREARVRYSVGHMGVSVLAGALTSLGASLLLFFCTLRFFSTFGIFFFGTILLAWLWANFFFIPALGTFGPAGTQGDFYGNMFGPKRSGTDAKAVVINPATADIDADRDCKPQG